jgi:hypothetical protein
LRPALLRGRPRLFPSLWHHVLLCAQVGRLRSCVLCLTYCHGRAVYDMSGAAPALWGCQGGASQAVQPPAAGLPPDCSRVDYGVVADEFFGCVASTLAGHVDVGMRACFGVIRWRLLFSCLEHWLRGRYGGGNQPIGYWCDGVCRSCRRHRFGGGFQSCSDARTVHSRRCMCGDGFQFDTESCIDYGASAVGLRCAGCSDCVCSASSHSCRVAMSCMLRYCAVMRLRL